MSTNKSSEAHGFMDFARGLIPRIVLGFTLTWMAGVGRGQGAGNPSPSAPVLDLDGAGSYVELPPRLFTNEVVTVEGWVKWREFGFYSRFFQFTDAALQIGVMNASTNAILQVERFRPPAFDDLKALIVPGILATNEWVHLAMVAGPDFAKLYFGGLLMATNEAGVNWRPDPLPPVKNYLGRSVMKVLPASADNADLNGQMAEVRLWAGERSEAQIRTNLAVRLTGREEGLLALWNFADGTARDATGQGRDGRLMGQAKVVTVPWPSAAAMAGQERVLELDGKDSYVELPPGIFKDLSEATVEAWVKWARVEEMRFFNAGELNHDVGLGSFGGGLLFFVRDESGGNFMVQVPDTVVSNEWSHVAAASGPGGMRLYLNGFLVGSNVYTGSFSKTGGSSTNWIGRWHLGTQTFEGQVDEIRVWGTQRTEEQTRGTMLKSLAGNEPGLVGYWNFNDGSASDSSAGRHHGKLLGNARVVPARRSDPSSLLPPVLLTGTVTDAAGRPLRNAEVVLRQGGTEVAKARTALAGTYRILLRTPKEEPYELKVTREDLGNSTNGLSLAGAGRKTLDFTLYEAPGVQGVITSADTRPRAGARVELEAVARTNIVAMTLSNARGEYRFRNVTSGAYRVRVAGPAGPVYFAEGRVVTTAERTAPVQADIRWPAPTAARPPASENRVLKLPGRGGHVALPSHIFNDLDEATIEGWVRWDRLGNWMRFFDFGKQERGLCLGNYRNSPDLMFEIFDAAGKPQGGDLLVAGVIQTNRWCHLAVVTGKGGVQVFFNGLVVATRPYRGSFSAAGNGDHQYLGRNNWEAMDKEVETLAGAMDEVRVWAVQRSGQEIREQMYRRLTGLEDGLVGLWNFDDPAQPGRDASPNGFDGDLQADATAGLETPPAADQLTNPTVLVAKVIGEKGGAMVGASVTVEQEGQRTQRGTADVKGEARFLLSSMGQPSNLSAQFENNSGRTLMAFLTNQVFQPGENRLELKLREFASLSGKILAFDGKPLEAVIVQAVGREVDMGHVSSSAGFLGEYFQRTNQALPRLDEFPVIPTNRSPDLVQTHHFIDFKGGGARPFVFPTGYSTNFYARWTGILRMERDENVTFKMEADDAARLWVDGEVVMVTDWNKGETRKVHLLTKGDHTLRLEYWQGYGALGCKLYWEGRGLSSRLDLEETPILASAATDAEGVYRFSSLPPGRYEVRAHVLGGLVDHPGPVGGVGASNRFRIVRGQETASVDFKIAPFKKGRWKTYTRTDGLASDQVVDIYQSRDGEMWVATFGGGASRWDGRRFVNYTRAQGLANDSVWSLAQDQTGAMWFGHNAEGEGVTRWDGRHFRVFTEKDGLVSAYGVQRVLVDRQGMVWIGTRRGLSGWEGARFVNYTATNGLPHPVVSALAEAMDGALWIGTPAGAVRKQGTNFVRVSMEQGLGGERVASMVQTPDGAMWLATEAGLSRWDGTNAVNYTVADGLPAMISAMAVDRNGSLWLGSLVEGVTRFDGKGCVRYTSADGLANNRVHAIHQDQDGVMWFGTFGQGLSRLDGESLVEYTRADGLPIDHVFCTTEDKDGILWIGTAEGLSCWNGQKFTNYTTAEGLPNNVILSVLATQAGAIWVGTPGGLARREGDRFETFTEADGLVSNFARALLEDSQGQLWIGTGGGLARWDGRHFENYTPADGLIAIGNPFYVHVVEDALGAIWFGNYQVSPNTGGASRWNGQGFDHFTPAEGLPNRRVVSMAADRKGGVWMGLDTLGAARWDGQKFQSYTPADGLGATFAMSLLEDSDGVIWFGHDGQVSLYDGVAWSAVALDRTQQQAKGSHVLSMHQDKNGAIWMGTESGLLRYRKSDPLKLVPTLRVTAGQEEHTDTARIPILSTGDRLTFDYGYVDRRTRPERQLFRHQIAKGRLTAGQLGQDLWSQPTSERHLDWATNRGGAYTFAVQYINQDLRYSEPTLASFVLAPPWHADPRITFPAGLGVVGLLGWAFVARSLYGRKRREAERLRERLLEEEHRAKEALEAKAAALAESNRQLDLARATADEASKAKSTFLANMSHELRTPLNAILGYSEMLQEETTDLGVTELNPDLQKIHGAGKHLLGLINDILDLSKIEAGKMTLFLEEFDVAKVVQDVASTVHPLIAKKANRLEVDCPADLGLMRADVTKVRQTLFNLLSNASKFTDHGVVRLAVAKVSGEPVVSEAVTSEPVISGSVTSGSVARGAGGGKPSGGVAAHPDLLNTDLLNTGSLNTDLLNTGSLNTGSLITFRVSDTGIGMTPEQVGRLFEAFSQADASTSKHYGGTGLGLALSKRFCELMGGSITVSSEPGQGSTFTVTLPVNVPDPAAVVSISSLRPGSSQAGAAVVLVIDDDPTVPDLLRRALAKEGFQVESASSGAQGLEMARRLRPRVITLDVMMPGLDGWAVLTALKADPATTDIPVVMMTMVDDRNLGFSLGASDYLTKPVDYARLHEVLAKHRPASARGVVLVIEDDTNTRELLVRQLEGAGWGTQTAVNGREGLERVAGRVPDLILLDLMMPEMDGFEFLEELRRNPAGAKVPVVVITAKTLTEDDRRRLNGGVSRILEKSHTSKEELLDEVRTRLATGR